MRRLLASVLLAVVLAIGFVAPVAASGPTRDVYAIGAGTLPAGEACAFPLAFEPIVANAHTLTFPEQPDGTVREQVSGRIVVRFTNTNTGKSVVYNISGPGRFVYYPDGSFTLTNYGPTFSWQTPAEGGPTAFLQHGRMVTQVDSPDFLFIVTERHGKTTDLCAVLS